MEKVAEKQVCLLNIDIKKRLLTVNAAMRQQLMEINNELLVVNFSSFMMSKCLHMIQMSINGRNIYKVWLV